MKVILDETKPIALQITQMIVDDIVEGRLKEEEQVPSTTEISKFYHINPATVRKGLQTLVDKEIIYKQRGIGMFVSVGAKEILIAERRKSFKEEFIKPLLVEAKKLNINLTEIIELLNRKDEKDD